MAQVPIGARGITPQVGRAHDGPSRVVLVANGDLYRTSTHVVTFDTTSCAVTLTPVKAALVNSAVLGAGTVYITNSGGTASEVTAVDARGADLRRVRLDGLRVSALVLHQNHLYAFAEGDANLTLVDLDPATLTTTRTLDLGVRGAPPWSAIGHGTKLYAPLARSGADGEGPSERLAVIDTARWQVEWVDVGAASPFLVRTRGDQLWVAHTFLNTAGRPAEGHRRLSRVDTATGVVTPLTVEPDVIDVAIGRSGVHVLTGPSLQADRVVTYAPTGSALGSVPLRGAPSEYVAAIIPGAERTP